MNTVSVSPLLLGLDKPIFEIFVRPKICFYNIEKDGSRNKKNEAIYQYKDFFYSDKELKRVFVQGDPGIGKSTFLTKLVLDWCNAVSCRNPDNKATFSDADTLKDFQFLFHISLRDAMGQREVIEMIKTQIIDNIYAGTKQTEAFELLQQILERETCLVTMDGLNEWTDHLKQLVVPRIPSSHTNCVSIITTRPWKMADERIKVSVIDRLLEIEGITDSEKLTRQLIVSLQTGNTMTHTDFMTYVNEHHFMHFFTSPWLQELIVNVWMSKTDIKGSLCEMNCILLDLLFKKANAIEGSFENGCSIGCLSSTRYIKKQIKIFDALANAAFQFTFSSNKSLTFSEQELRKYLSKKHLKFCIKAGVLTARFNSIKVAQGPQYSFTHETIQEFLAAFHIANSQQDLIANFKPEHKYSVLEMSQTVIYLYGLKCETANKLLNRLVDGDFVSDISNGLSLYIKHYSANLSAFQRDKYTKETVIKSKRNEMNCDARCLEISVLFQHMVIAGFNEAKISGQKDIFLYCMDFTFNTYLLDSESRALKEMLSFNKSNVRSLILENNVLDASELLSVMQQSKHSLQRLKTAVTPEIYKALHNMNIQELYVIGQIDESSFSNVLPSLSNLMLLSIEDSNLLEQTVLPGTIEYIYLLKCSCTAVFLRRLLVYLASVQHGVKLYLEAVIVTHPNSQIFLPELLLSDMTNIDLSIEHGNHALYDTLRCTSIGELDLHTSDDVSLASKIMYTLKRLTYLNLWGTYSERCSFQLPDTLQCISLQEVKCSAEWLCSLVIALSSLDHSVDCILYSVLLQPSADACGDDSQSRVSDLRSEIMSRDMSKIELFMETVSVELFEIFRGTNIGILTLQNAECASLASTILYTLKNLTKLYLWGTYSERCNLQLPATLQCVSLEEVECTAEWLYSFMIALSSFDHSVACELLDVVLQPNAGACGDDSQARVSDLRSEVMSHDMSEIEIFVQTGSVELFEIFQGTNIGILKLKTVECALLESTILHSLKKLTKLVLLGTYSERCTLQLPETLQCISLQEVECTAEWLCSLLIALSLLDHSVACELWDVVLEPSAGACGDDFQARVSELRSEIMSHDMSEIEIFVETDSVELFEIFRGTNIGILKLETSECALLESTILHSLKKLTKLYLWGTYSERCTLRLPESLQCISLQEVDCTAEWLCSLLIALSSLDHSVVCELLDVVLHPNVDACEGDSQTNSTDLRSELLSLDMSNMTVEVRNGSGELFEIFRGTHIGILKLTTAECASLVSKIMYTLKKLTGLYLWGTYSERCTLQLPATLRTISLQKIECSAEWLCSLLIALSSLEHSVVCILWGVVLQSSGDACGDDCKARIPDLRSEIMSHDMSEIEICVETGSVELFEIFRDTNIRILTLQNADCALLESTIIHSLRQLTKLYLRGTYSERCTLQLPASLQCVSLEEVECSAEWLRGLLTALSSLDHYVACELWDVVLEPCEDARGDDCQTHVSDLRPYILSCDMSLIKIFVKNGSGELFEIFRGTNIGILTLNTADCASLHVAFKILYTLHKLTKLILWGTYSERCTLQLPETLQCISLQEVECSAEWLCSLLIALSSLDHPVECELWIVKLQLCADACGDDFQINATNFRSEILSLDMSNMTISVRKGSVELFEILRDTNIGALDLLTADCASLASLILYSLKKLTKLYLRGTYSERCTFHLPAALQCISLQEVECSAEWLCSLFISLSSLNHSVKCELFDVVLQPCEDARGNDFLINSSDLRSEILSRDMTQIELLVENGSVELYELLRDTQIGILEVETA
ncbi:hypothetical protein DPMN_127409 [Dreissena polymorpha]|uniref:NACHT domain-containing protein n=2 Tax=Dreissena polymorpha TaxID=45954 RepID=A0A9D4JVF1_DREPO|nr:hypothetical protein DPMN_127409 [Dreissena polymorpha]